MPDGPTIAARAAVCITHGPPEDLVVEVVDIAAPGSGEARVRVTAAAVNFPDVLIIANRYQLSVPTPFVPGSEFAGTVVDVGPGVNHVAPGDQVFGAVMFGAFAEHVVVPAAGLMKVPTSVDPRTAAGFWVAYSTAYHALRSVAAVQPGERVVVLGAAGGVGLAAVEVAALLGAEVIAAASNASRLALCKERGAHHAIDYTTQDLRAAIREITGGGADVVIDPVGAAWSEAALRAMRWGGRFVTVGFASGEIPRIPLNLVLLKGVAILGIDVRTFAENRPADAERDRAELLQLLGASRIVPHVDAVYALDEIVAALRCVADRRALGKVLIDVTRGGTL